MPKYVIDTNVAVTANGADSTVRLECTLAAIRLLQKAINRGKVYLDLAGEIQTEYRRYLNPSGQPGVGDMFYQEILRGHPNKVEWVEVARRPDGEYEDVPTSIVEAGFDPSDRKFIAVAKKVGADIYNAVDADWVEKREVIAAAGVEVVCLCGCNSIEWRVA